MLLRNNKYSGRIIGINVESAYTTKVITFFYKSSIGKNYRVRSERLELKFVVDHIKRNSNFSITNKL